MGTSAGQQAVSSISSSPAKLVRNPKSWLETDGQNLAAAASLINPASASGLYQARAASGIESGTITGRQVANLVPGFDVAARGAQYATRGAGGTEAPLEIPVVPEEQTPQRRRRGRAGRAGTILTDAGAADMSSTLGTIGGRSSLLGL
jgi:hypothetical protein